MNLPDPGHKPWTVCKGRTFKPLAERFFEKVVEHDGCWNWMAKKSKTGYGRIGVKGDKQDYAHRVAYRLMRGPIPDGLTIDHLCRNRGCVNPAHMEVVSSRTNTLRGNSVGAINARKTHCKHGHEFTPENTYHSRGRKCRTCCLRLKAAQWRRNKTNRPPKERKITVAKTLANSIFDYIRTHDGVTFSEIQHAHEKYRDAFVVGPFFRKIDRALQTLRRQGLISYRDRKWRA